MVVARRRQRRRPVVPLLALLLTLMVVLLRVADGSSGDRDAVLAWLDEVRPVVADSNQLGAELRDLRTSLTDLDRPAATRRAERLEREAESHVRRADAVDRPGGLRDAHALLISTLAVRARAVADLGPALDSVLGDAPVGEAIDRLGRIGDDLVVADRTYQLFVEVAPEPRPGVTVASAWVDDPVAWERGELGAWVASVRASRAPGPVHDLRVVTVGLDPPPVGKDGAADVFPLTRNLRLQVVVANVGNDAEERVVVTASVGLPGGAPDTARQFVDLGVGQRQVVQLGGLAPPANQAAVISVRIEPVEGETSIVDNLWERQAIFR
jgi:hypothetical protein